MRDLQRLQTWISGGRIGGTLLVAAMTLSACSKEVVVKTNFPDPIIPSLELAAGVFYSDALRNYDYSEDLPNDVDWSFTLGEANVVMFDRALGALFDELQEVDQPGGAGAPFDRLDLVIEPAVEAFEFSLPRQSRSDQYAVWIRYNVSIHEPDGQLITKWQVSAYGQADSKLLRGGTAMEAAVVRAMRDAIANIVIGLPEEPKFKAALLPEEPGAGELAAEPLPTGDAPAEEDSEDDTPAEDAPPAESAVEEVQS